MAVTELLLPRTSDAMTEATLSAWLVPSGAEVAQGDLVAEVETDKAMVEVRAEVAGVIVAAVAEGATIEVGSTLAFLLNGQDIEDHRAGRLHLGSGPIPATPVDQDAPLDPAPAKPIPVASTPAPPVNGATTAPKAPHASPLARRLAREHGLLLEDLSPGTGPNGRIVRDDVLGHVQAAPAGNEALMSGRQKSMVAAMVAAKSQIPHFYLFRDIDLTTVLAYRRDLKESGLEAPSVTAIALKALGLVLADMDFARRRWHDGRVLESAEAHVGFAVSDGIADIVVPVLRAPAALSLEGIAGEVRRLSDAVRTRKLRQEDMTGAVATISNLGMFGIDALLPIIPPSQTFIIGMGRDRPELYLDALERVKSRNVVTLGFAGDHRVMTGVGGARIMERMDELLQHPLLLAAAIS